MVDLTRDEHGRLHARLLDVVPGRSGTAYAGWLKAQQPGFVAGVEHAALDPFRGYANAIRDELAVAVAVLDAFHIVKLGTQALDEVGRPRPTKHPRSPRVQARPALGRSVGYYGTATNTFPPDRSPA